MTPPDAATAPTVPAPAPAPNAAGPLSGLDALDLSHSRRVPILMEMVEGLSRASDPREVLRQFADGFLKLWGPRGYVSLSTRGLEPGEYKITRLVTTNLADEFANADPWRDWARLPAHRGGIFGRIVRHGGPVALRNLDLRDDPVVGSVLAQYRSLMAIPLFDDGRPFNWSITLREDARGFGVEEVEESILRSNLGGAAVRNALITKQLREAHEEIRREIDQIARIQRALLPEIPRIPGLEIGVTYETFDQAGGDMYALRPLRPVSGTLDGRGFGDACDPAGPWGILVADVSGHGPAAAVVMAMVRAIMDAYPREPRGPAEVLEHANRHLCAKRIQQRFVTAFMAVYDPDTRRFTYSRAGHNPPVWMRPGSGDGWDMARLGEVGGLPLGIEDDTAYEEATVQLEPNQTIVLYTDGITEALSPTGAMFGVEGIERSLTECSGSPSCAIDHIGSTLRAHESGVRPTDDQTLVILQVT